ncbi:MAG: cytochrome c biogenesis protein CcdA [Candidatus Poseidoniaceae archaeon]|jgi:cytochrome c-type biogenesis protein
MGALSWFVGIGSSVGNGLKQADFSVFKQGETWKAFGIAALMFVTISFAALSMFDSMDEVFASDAEPAPVPNMVFESLNRTGIESNLTNETGWINLNDHRGDIIILDFMAHDCSNCHAVQEHLEAEMDAWMETANASGKNLKIFGYGAWYSETLDYLNETSGAYHVPAYPTGLGSLTAAEMSNGTTADPVRLFTTGGSGQIPVVMILDAEGYIIAKEATGTPSDGWAKFDGVLDTALTGTTQDTMGSRIAWEEPDTSYVAVFILGMVLSILVYFSPCAFPVLPGFISYYLSLGAREDELIASGKLKTKMPSSWVIGLLSGVGMWTFFGAIGIVALLMGEAFAASGLIHYIAIFIAVLLIVLGGMMLLGITSHLMGFVDRLVRKYSTTEADETFTPRRNMYLYGIGYAAASIDCTAAAVLPFVLYLSTLGPSATGVGIGGLMIGLLFLMVVVTVMVGMGRQVMINFLRRSTGMIKMVGSWMMIMAGISLTIYLTNPALIGGLFS